MEKVVVWDTNRTPQEHLEFLATLWLEAIAGNDVLTAVILEDLDMIRSGDFDIQDYLMLEDYYMTELEDIGIYVRLEGVS